MFSDELHCIGLYTPFEPESNPPPREQEIFHDRTRVSHHALLNTDEGPESPCRFGKNSGPSCYEPKPLFLLPLGAELASSAYLAHGNFNVNQVERAFMPFRSTLEPSHTANAIGTEAPALNWVSLASPVSSERFTTTRQVGPVYPPPLRDPDGSHTPLPITS